MPVETGGLVEVVHLACGGFVRFVQGREMVPLFIPGFGVIKGYFLAGFYSKLPHCKSCSPFFGPLCFSVLKREDISYAFFNHAEVNAACAVVMTTAERYESLKHIVQPFACFKVCLRVVAIRHPGRLFIFETPFEIRKIGQSRHSAMSKGA